MPRTTVDELVARARARLDRLEARVAAPLAARGEAVLVDIRGSEQRARDGAIPGAVTIARNVLEWRADPASQYRDPRIARPEARIVLVCHEGYQSSLAAATLQDLGLPHATDLAGGFLAWRAAGLPVEPARS